jgi:signal transduction histidine kinase
VNVAAGFAKRLIAEQALSTLLAFVALALLGSTVLRLDSDLVLDVVGRVSAVGAAATIAALLATTALVRPHRFLLRALAMGSKAIEPPDFDGVRRLPYVTAWTRVVVSAPFMLALVWARPAAQSGEAARELALLGITILLATSIPGFVLAQKSVGRLLEIAPLEPVTERLQDLDARGILRKRGRQNLVLAVVVPVALVGVSGVLASYAHLRAATEASREATARTLGRGVLGADERAGSAGQVAALRTARALGYEATLTDEAVGESMIRTPDDRLVMTLPTPGGGVSVAFGSGLGFETTFPLAATALAFVVAAAVAAAWLARLISIDLSSSTERLRTLGTERVLRGQNEEFVARFGVVGRLGEAALALAGRFRVFAAAQERALEAKETASRMRGLLFASVSHDLKTPLNAIVGFADSIDPATLTSGQRESLDLISTRGRELVALIETILDAARVDVGELSLVRQRTTVEALLTRSAARARQLSSGSGELHLELADGLVPVEIDDAHLTRALAVILAHALRAPTPDGTPARVTARATLAQGGRRVRIDIDHGTTTLTAAELGALFKHEAGARAKGLTLGLALARSIFELHQGSVDVSGGPGQSLVVTASLPVMPLGTAATAG